MLHYPTRFFFNLQRIVLFHSGGTTCNRIDAKSPCPKGMHYWHQYALESRADPEEITEPSNSKKSCFVRHSYQQPENVSTGEESEPRSQSGSSFFAVNNFIQTPDEKVSKMANAYSFLQDKVAVCSEKNPDMLVNIVSVDFWHHGDLVEFVQKENQRRGTLKSFLAV